MAEVTHSKIGASSHYRWSVCPGSVKLSEGIPNRSSKYAEEGTEAHEVGAYYLLNNKWPEKADEEILDAVQVYTSTVLQDISLSKDPDAKMSVEVKFDLSAVYPGLFGTADCVVYFPKTKLLRVYDYKHGAGIAVEVEGNTQLMYYGLGALLHDKDPCVKVELVIVQPRCPHLKGPVRRHALDPITLIDFAADLIEAVKKTEDPNAKLVAGDHCRFCPASPICPTLASMASNSVAARFSSLEAYEPQKLSELLTWLPVLEAWAKNVREFAYGEVERGRSIPGWKLVQKRATRKWRSESDTIQFLTKNLGVSDKDIFSEPSLKSPAQVEKLLSKDQKQKISELVVSESSGYTLAPEDDKRDAVPDAKTGFSALTT